MTDQELRDLLHDRVADETMTDLSGVAWRAGQRVRRRRGGAAFLAAAASVVAIVGVSVAVTGNDGTDPSPAPSPSPTPTPDPVSTEPDAAYEGVPVWWSPDQVEERSLPRVAASPLPEAIGTSVVESMSASLLGPAAIAAFGRGDKVYLHGADGGAEVVDVSSLDDVAKENGYRISPLTDSMLSPDGRHLVFPQDGELVLYDVANATWSGFSTGDAVTVDVTWVDNETLWLPSEVGQPGPMFDLEGNSVQGVAPGVPDPGFDTGEAQAFGRRPGEDPRAAQSWGMGVDLPLRSAEYGTLPEFLGARVEGGPVVLAFMNLFTDGQDSRWKDCCPVAGWLDSQTVVYESRQSSPRLIAWTVGTDQFRLVSTIRGRYDVASFALPG